MPKLYFSQCLCCKFTHQHFAVSELSDIAPSTLVCSPGKVAILHIPQGLVIEHQLVWCCHKWNCNSPRNMMTLPGPEDVWLREELGRVRAPYTHVNPTCCVNYDCDLGIGWCLRQTAAAHFPFCSIFCNYDNTDKKKGKSLNEAIFHWTEHTLIFCCLENSLIVLTNALLRTL